MEVIERVKICKRCSNRTFDMNKGILCGLTGEVASFEVNCSDYNSDKEAIEKEDRLDLQKVKYFRESDEGIREESRKKLKDIEAGIDPVTAVKSGARWFYWIAGLSLVNSIALLIDSQFSFMAGLGFTQFIDGVIIELTGGYTIIGFLPSLAISLFFGGIGYLANQFSKTAFVIGMVFYALDSIVFLLVSDWLSLGFHAFALFMIYKGFKQLDKIKGKDELEMLDENLD